MPLKHWKSFAYMRRNDFAATLMVRIMYPSRTGWSQPTDVLLFSQKSLISRVDLHFLQERMLPISKFACPNRLSNPDSQAYYSVLSDLIHDH